ncbi:SRPBCC family protein [Salsipaludibacter albus]|uniref:SRPBCC family protein n=1 Tax=Salsipaludibacter albus TaxID=2849650 RepID=UPI001EE425F7|nr:carbon monoxide dehydrogenase subunit G [Salsipaludibacter albus]MBY5163020.1 carbon monoxide dehydrogenase subunit G [Salsipaludibacter albus]
MNISGTNHIDAPRDDVWAALTDPAVLARTLPGCEQLEVVDDDTYRARVTAGVASIRGTYDGTVRLSDRDRPSSLHLHVQGAGAPGTIGADVEVRLEATDVGTEVDWDAEAVVGGMIGGVGQRMLAGVSSRMAGEFFAALERDLVEGPAVPAAASDAGTTEGVPSEAAPATTGQVFAGRAASGDGGRTDLVPVLAAFVLGAAAALAGVLVGRRLR